jgi:glutamate-1-semialdehyde aminotransferase
MKYQDIVERARALAEKPVRKLKDGALERAVREFTTRTPTSARLAAEACKLLPRGSEHSLPLAAPYPLFMDHGKGSRVWDVDGNEYLDYILSGGAILLGHNNEGLRRSMVDLIQKRTHFHGFSDEMEIKAAEKMTRHMPSMEKVRFLSSGAEANTAALRIARSFTGRKKVIKFMGHYHGWADQFMTDMEVPGSGRFISHGVPSEILDLTVLVPPNDLDALERAFSAHASSGGIAAVFSEPVGGESGLVPFAEGFHQAAMEIAHRHGALYVFDEVVTGLRMGLGGAQAVLGVKPDLTTMGKALMSGYPSCGAVGGKAEIMDTASTGLPDERPYAYVVGTLAGNTLSSAAAYYTFVELEKPGILERMFAAAADYVDKLNALFSSKGVGFFSYNYGGIIRIELTAPHAVPLTSPEKLQEVVFRRRIIVDYSIIVMARGVLSRMGRDMISCSHTLRDNDMGAAAYAALVDALE